MLAGVPNAKERDAAWALKNSALEAKNKAVGIATVRRAVRIIEFDYLEVKE